MSNIRKNIIFYYIVNSGVTWCCSSVETRHRYKSVLQNIKMIPSEKREKKSSRSYSPQRRTLYADDSPWWWGCPHHHQHETTDLRIQRRHRRVSTPPQTVVETKTCTSSSVNWIILLSFSVTIRSRWIRPLRFQLH